MTTDFLRELTELGYQYGPFAFSLMFLYSISRWAYKKYDEASKQKDPPARADQIRSTRLTYLISFIAGIVLVGVSVAWWFVHHPIYVYTGIIRNLDSNTFIYSDSLYFLERPHPLNGPDDVLIRDEQFVVISERPFKRGQLFPIDFRKNKELRDHLRIDYDPDDTEPQFEPDFQNGKNILKRISNSAQATNQTAFNWFRTSVAYAQEKEPVATPSLRMMSTPQQKTRSPLRRLSQSANRQEPELDKSVFDALEDSRSDVGTKLKAIDKLESLDPDSMSRYLRGSFGNIPLSATILDLTRHSDPELAYEASTLIRKFDLDHYLQSGLTSKDAKVRADAELVLGHLDRPAAEKVVANVKQSEGGVRVTIKDLAFIPTNFPEGDRYYMKVSWKAKDEKERDCLADFFSSSLDVPGTPPNKTGLILGRSQLVIYSIDKEWVTGAVGRIEHCGGSVAFIRPNYSWAKK